MVNNTYFLKAALNAKRKHQGVAKSDSIKQATDSMAMLNKLAGSILTKFSVNAATDITGFGLTYF